MKIDLFTTCPTGRQLGYLFSSMVYSAIFLLLHISEPWLVAVNMAHACSGVPGAIKDEEFLGVAPLVQETEYVVALEVYGRLLNLECDTHLAEDVFDSRQSIWVPRRRPPFTFSACLTDLS